MQFAGFTDEERRAVLLAHTYEKVRQEYQGIGYKMFRGLEDVRQEKGFASLLKVVHWLAEKGWGVTWNEVNWRGYVKFCFESLHPTIPYAAQLKNEILLKDYLSQTVVLEEVTERTAAEMMEIYRRCVDPDIIADPTASRILGLRQV